MDIYNHCSTLYSKLIEESVRGGEAYYRPDHLASNPWNGQLRELNRKTQPRPSWLLCVKLAGLPVMRIRLPRWVTVRMMP